MTSPSETASPSEMTTPSEMASANFDVVLFDLGGVLVRLGGVSGMRELTGIEDEDEIMGRWLRCPWVRSFERGRCSSDQFATGLVADWGLPVTPEAFLDRFRAWPAELYDGANQLVDDVRTQTRVGCLSNTNEVHWAEVTARWRVGEMFDSAFLSHELGLVKPDREVFEHVVLALAVPADRVLFLDDVAANVVQAQSLGLTAVQVRGVREARRALVERGVLPEETSRS